MIQHIGFALGLMIGLIYITVAIGVWKSAGGIKLQNEDKFMCFIVSAGWILAIPFIVIIMIMDVSSTWIGDKITRLFQILGDWKERNT